MYIRTPQSAFLDSDRLRTAAAGRDKLLMVGTSPEPWSDDMEVRECGGGGVLRLAATDWRRLSSVLSAEVAYICGGGETLPLGCASPPQKVYPSVLRAGLMCPGVRGAIRPSSLRPRRPMRGIRARIGESTDFTREDDEPPDRGCGEPERSIVPPRGVDGADESAVRSISHSLLPKEGITLSFALRLRKRNRGINHTQMAKKVATSKNDGGSLAMGCAE